MASPVGQDFCCEGLRSLEDEVAHPPLQEIAGEAQQRTLKCLNRRHESLFLKARNVCLRVGSRLDPSDVKAVHGSTDS